jgi:hypothetical protein
MSLNIAAVDPVMIAIVVVNAIVIAMAGVMATIGIRRARRQKRKINAVTHAIIDYFKQSGIGVAAGCVSFSHNRFTVFIESEPMKRFRLSHIIEATLRDHVKKACGLEVEKIYWRFPIRQVAADAAGKEEKPKEDTDEYINEGLVNYRHLPKVEAEELSWENFEAVSQKMEQTTTQPK